MKKLIIVLLFFPVLLHCKKKDDVDDDKPVAKTCYLSKEITKDYSLKYDRNSEGNLTKHTFFIGMDTNSYAVYIYNGSELVKRQNFSSSGEIGDYDLHERSGNTLTIANYGRQHITSKQVFTFNSDSRIGKVVTFDYKEQKDTLEETYYRIYEYPNQFSAIAKFYNSTTNQLQSIESYTFDDKKNPKVLNNDYPEISVHNIIQHTRTFASGEVSFNYNYSYTYNENNYPSSVTFNGSTTTYEYDCN